MSTERYKACIVIPVHSATPSSYELVSFKQCFSILGSYPIYVIAPEGLSLNSYKEAVSDFKIISIHPKWQKDLIAYNKLKRSRFFYSLFDQYDYLLTYELDAFVFKDELQYWCSKGYDYIGAPWFKGYISAEKNNKLIGVGNSGFSLRAIKPIQKVLRSMYYKNPAEYTGIQNRLIAHLKTPFRWLMSQTGENYTVQNNFPFYEDIFFSRAVPKRYASFKVAPIEEAVKFSFEVNPDYLFELNNQQLPMGCHAWWRYNLDFWRPFIESYGYRL